MENKEIPRFCSSIVAREVCEIASEIDVVWGQAIVSDNGTDEIDKSIHVFSSGDRAARPLISEPGVLPA